MVDRPDQPRIGQPKMIYLSNLTHSEHVEGSALVLLLFRLLRILLLRERLLGVLLRIRLVVATHVPLLLLHTRLRHRLSWLRRLSEIEGVVEVLLGLRVRLELIRQGLELLRLLLLLHASAHWLLLILIEAEVKATRLVWCLVHCRAEGVVPCWLLERLRGERVLLRWLLRSERVLLV